MLKQKRQGRRLLVKIQPPSGGCVLKLFVLQIFLPMAAPAAFRRLCVETCFWNNGVLGFQTSRLQAAVC